MQINKDKWPDLPGAIQRKLDGVVFKEGKEHELEYYLEDVVSDLAWEVSKLGARTQLQFICLCEGEDAAAERLEQFLLDEGLSGQEECPNCGKAVPTYARFCSHCAEPLPDQSESEIQARLVSDGVEVEVGFDAAEVLSDWPVEAIQGLKNECTSVYGDYWGPGEISDQVALESSDPRVTLFFRWLGMYNQQAYRAEGYSCVVDAGEAMKWLGKNRPEVAKQLEKDNG